MRSAVRPPISMRGASVFDCPFLEGPDAIDLDILRTRSRMELRIRHEAEARTAVRELEMQHLRRKPEEPILLDWPVKTPLPGAEMPEPRGLHIQRDLNAWNHATVSARDFADYRFHVASEAEGLEVRNERSLN